MGPNEIWYKCEAESNENRKKINEIRKQKLQPRLYVYVYWQFSTFCTKSSHKSYILLASRYFQPPTNNSRNEEKKSKKRSMG